MQWKWLIVSGVLCVVACKRSSKETALPSAGEVLQKMSAREKALSSFSIQVHTEEEGMAVEHRLLFRAPDLIRVDVEQPQKQVLGFDGRHYYRLEEAEKKLTLLHLKLPTGASKLALSVLMGAFVPEGFQSPKVIPRDLKLSWLDSNRILRLENHVGDGNEGVNIAYVVRWPSLDFLKKEVFMDGQKHVEYAMQEEQCMPAHNLCIPTRIVARRDAEVFAQKVRLLSFQEAAGNEHFVLQAPEGFVVERHSISSLKELEAFLH